MNNSTTETDVTKAAKPKAKLDSAIKALLAFYAVLFILIVAGLGFFGYNWYETQSRSQQDGSVQLQVERNTLDSKVHQQDITIRNQQKLLLSLKQQLQQQASTVRYHGLQRVLEEVAYLLNTADLYLSVNHDVHSAKELLKIAQARLNALPSPQLLSVKRSVNHDLNQLNQVQSTDTAAIIMQLGDLSKQVAKLKLINKLEFAVKPQQTETVVDASAADNTEASTSPQNWQQKALGALSGLKGLIIIRRVQEPVKPLLSDAQIQLLQQNLQLALAGAQWAVLHENNKLFQYSLAQAKQQLTHYPQQDGLTTINNELERLAKLNLKPDLPSLQASINSVDRMLNQQHLSDSKSQNDRGHGAGADQQTQQKKENNNESKPNNISPLKPNPSPAVEV